MNKSFTLIEILVVIVVIGVLSAFILVGMSSITSKSSIAKGLAYANSMRNALLLNLVSEWKLDGNGNDSWGVNNAATNTATLITSGCVNGSCYSFDGSDDVIDFGNNASLSMGTRDHTASIWVKFDNRTAPQNETLLACGAGCGAGANCGGYWIRRYNGDSSLIASFADGTASSAVGDLSAGVLFANTWYNVVVVFDRDGAMQAYVDGKLQSGYSVSISSRQQSVSNYKALSIGAWSSGDSSLTGDLDEIKLYHAILSVSSINQNYYTGVNNLLVNGEINGEDFSQRIVELKYNLVNK